MTNENFKKWENYDIFAKQLKMDDNVVEKCVQGAIDSNRKDLQSLSEEIWHNPELSFEEHKAHQLLTDYLEKKGFSVERGCCDLSTAFRATYGSGGASVCVICEYDALPEIGHACGHNLIAEAGVAAGLGVKAFLEETGSSGRLTVLGTPAEEGGGGKVFMIEKGAFEGLDMAMMVHPSPFDCVIPGVLANHRFRINYAGKAAHAAGFPWEGVNALDAAVMAYTSISALRQQMKPTWRVHGIITNGGVKPNIIPEKTTMDCQYRAPNLTELQVLEGKLEACFQAAAQATGCTVNCSKQGKLYRDLQSNPVLSRLYAENIKKQGVTECAYEGGLLGSTDMGNVSHLVPSIHPVYRVGNGEVNHTREFTSVCNTPEAHQQTLTAAKSMALTCINVLTGGDKLLQDICAQFKKDE